MAYDKKRWKCLIMEQVTPTHTQPRIIPQTPTPKQGHCVKETSPVSLPLNTEIENRHTIAPTDTIPSCLDC